MAKEIRNCRVVLYSVLMRTSLTPLFCALGTGEGPNAWLMRTRHGCCSCKCCFLYGAGQRSS